MRPTPRLQPKLSSPGPGRPIWYPTLRIYPLLHSAMAAPQRHIQSNQAKSDSHTQQTWRSNSMTVRVAQPKVIHPKSALGRCESEGPLDRHCKSRSPTFLTRDSALEKNYDVIARERDLDSRQQCPAMLQIWVNTKLLWKPTFNHASKLRNIFVLHWCRGTHLSYLIIVHTSHVYRLVLLVRRERIEESLSIFQSYGKVENEKNSLL